MFSLVLVLSFLRVNAIEISSYARVSKKSSISTDGHTNMEDNDQKKAPVNMALIK